ncbi:hypothetical protein K450DRAFT_251066 [Umbelopsis ramanniana AG]|uniref:Uncharacterized protein n=1 Tax=Umbelopsis ramanniana AG TaxID=1314678 RepID=A0AAD5E7G9_UMBRA|nr:uncharacterized protein K450DRAFT_251066 [Umbelopsis ramanniana AG]KAI8577646.1 hypothetical protein K450DRAFT_251066 [Umbelopsis ramanniana AG]
MTFRCGLGCFSEGTFFRVLRCLRKSNVSSYTRRAIDAFPWSFAAENKKSGVRVSPIVSSHAMSSLHPFPNIVSYLFLTPLSNFSIALFEAIFGSSKMRSWNLST